MNMHLMGSMLQKAYQISDSVQGLIMTEQHYSTAIEELLV